MYIIKAEQKDQKKRFGRKLKYSINISYINKKVLDKFVGLPPFLLTPQFRGVICQKQSIF